MRRALAPFPRFAEWAAGAPWWAVLAAFVGLIVVAALAGMWAAERARQRWTHIESVQERRGDYAAWKSAKERGWKREARELRAAAIDELNARAHDLSDDEPVREAP